MILLHLNSTSSTRFFNPPSKLLIETITILLLALVAKPNESFSQAHTHLSGIAIDSLAQTPIAYATVYLTVDSTIKATTLSDSSGFFSFTNLPNGQYAIKIHSFNYENKFIPVLVTGKQANQDLGKIYLIAQNNILNEITISIQKIISQSVDRIKYDVQKDPEQSSANVLTIMSKVPLLSIDGHENIKYQGGSNFLILINNKPSAIMARNPSQVLRNMPASTIESIEVITSPSAKYLSEGVTGVINIITKKKLKNGYEGVIGMDYRTPAAGTSTSLSNLIKIGKWGITPYFSFTEYKLPETSTELRKVMYDSNNNLLEQYGLKQSTKSTSIFSTDVGYEIDSLQLLNARFGQYHLRNRRQIYLLTSINLPEQELMQKYANTTKENSTSMDMEIGIDYQKQYLSDKDKSLIISYLYTSGRENLKNTIDFNNQINFDDKNLAQINFYKQNEHSVQLDYIQSLKNTKANFGAKGVARLGESQFQNIIFGTPGNKSDEPFQSPNNFNNDLMLYLVYNSYQFEFKPFEFIAGYRMEFTDSKSKFQKDGISVSNNYFHLIPNVTIGLKWSQTSRLTLIYNQTIQRPNISYLNPFVNVINPNLQIEGNPFLNPVKTSHVNLQYSRFAKNSFILSLLYNYTSNDIQQIFSASDSSAVTKLTYANIGRNDNIGLAANYSISLSKVLNGYTSGIIKYVKLKNSIENNLLTNSGWIVDVNLGLSYTPSKSIQFSGRFSYSSPNLYLLGKVNNYPYYVFSSSKTFLSDRLSVTATVVNPLKKFQYIETTYSDISFNQTATEQIYNRSIMLRASYKIGKLKDQIKRSNKSITNDDEISIKR